ncbi:MAG TPA: hypothetical protein VMV72_07290 [Verrucomicrobiae bacterium]|nr:hypothetical protein [Verrucomicrobiae bacterium]
MKCAKILVAMAIVCLTVGARATRAEIANGSYSTDISGSAPVWDISGDYSGDPGLGLDLDFSISQDASGDFTGSGSFEYDDWGGNYLSGDINASGSVKTAGDTTSVSMNLSLSGSGTVVVDEDGDTDDVDFNASAKISFSVDEADGQLVVTSGSVGVTVTDQDTGKKKSAAERLEKGGTMDLPSSSTGGWNLGLNLTPTGTKYKGTATIQTSTGVTAQLNATGTYQAKTDTSKLTLKGSGTSLNLVVSTSGSTVTIQSAKGKLLGQTVNYKAR